MYEEVSVMIKRMEERSSLLAPEQPGASELQSRIMGLKDQLVKEKDEYDVSEHHLTEKIFFEICI